MGLTIGGLLQSGLEGVAQVGAEIKGLMPGENVFLLGAQRAADFPGGRWWFGLDLTSFEPHHNQNGTGMILVARF